MLQPKPEIYERIFLFGSPNSVDVGSVGGIWSQPQLGLSYLLAARHVIEGARASARLSDVLMPAAYLQRHALEVELKSLIEACNDIEHNSAWLALLQVDREAPAPARPTEDHRHHLLVDLCSSFATKVRALGFGELPASLVALCERVAKLEADAPERFRYLHVQFGKKTKAAKTIPFRPSFEDVETLPVIEIQNETESVFRDVFDFEVVDDAPAENGSTLATRLGFECYTLSQSVGYIIW